MGFIWSFLEILRKSLYFVAFFPCMAVFPLEIPKILKMVTYKVTNLLKVALDRVDIRQNFPVGPTCQSFLFIVTCTSCDQSCPFAKFPKSSFLVLLSGVITVNQIYF